MKKQILCLALILIFATSSVSFRNASASGSTNPAPASLSEQLGAFIIIAGARSDFALQNLINYGCDQVYSIVTTFLGFPADRVYYLGPTVGDPVHPNVQAVSNLANIADTIENWAKPRVDSSHGLGIYMFDHGGTDIICIPGGVLADWQLQSYLTNLQSSSGCARNILLYEACESGSFINTLSHSNKIVVTSTDATHSAYGSATWAIFSESFWAQIAAGTTIGNAFISGASNVITTGYGGVQYPLIDDNGDHYGHQPFWFPLSFLWMPPIGLLANYGDGYDALNTVIQGENAPVPIPIPWIALAPLHIYLPGGAQSIPIWAQVPQGVNITHIYARIIPPYWTPPSPPSPDINGSQMVQDNSSWSS